MEEVWKDVVGYEGSYQVSNLGRVKSIDRNIKGQHFPEKIMKQQENRYGYKTVSLSKKGKHTRAFVARLVAIAFIPNPDNLPCVGHKDDIPSKENNTVENLYWTTFEDNNKTPNRRMRLSKSLKGREFSEQTKRKMSENHANIARGNNPHAKAVMCENMIFACIKDCAEYYNVPYPTFKNWINGTNPMPERFKLLGLKYFNEEEPNEN